MPNVIDVTGKDNELARLFIQGSFSEIPEWIPYLPSPGSWDHPVYGDIVITPERNKNFIENFKKGVYQSEIPIDAEHESKLSGAYAYVTDMRQNSDGSVDAQVRWTDRGKIVMEGERFKYFSPEFYPTWEDPATGETHNDVAIGGALTTRPFFKDSSLRPLVATEDGIFDLQENSTNEEIVVNFIQLSELENGGSKNVDNVNETVEEVVEEETTEDTSVLASENATLQRQNQTLTEVNEAQAQQLKELEGRVNELTRQRLSDRYTALVLGNTEGGTRWFGDVEKHVAMLINLSETHGEDSDLFKNYVEMSTSAAQTMSDSGAFTSIGSDASPETGKGDQHEVDRLAEAKMSENSNLEYGDAVAAVFRERPDLHRTYSHERIYRR